MSRTIVIGCLLIALTSGASAQKTDADEVRRPAFSTLDQHGGGHKVGPEDGRFPEIEALISNEFRTISYAQPLFRQLNLEVHYFGVKRAEEVLEPNRSAEERDGHIDVGVVNASWGFRCGEHVTLTPGFGIYFGNHHATSPAITFRWEIEKSWFFSQGLFVGAVRESEEFGRVNVWDGNHLSVRWKRLELGPSWERIHTRDENDWKGGGRAALRFARHFSVVLFVLAPKTEFRAGVILHPTREP